MLSRKCIADSKWRSKFCNTLSRESLGENNFTVLKSHNFYIRCTTLFPSNFAMLSYNNTPNSLDYIAALIFKIEDTPLKQIRIKNERASFFFYTSRYSLRRYCFKRYLIRHSRVRWAINTRTGGREKRLASCRAFCGRMRRMKPADRAKSGKEDPRTGRREREREERREAGKTLARNSPLVAALAAFREDHYVK